MTTTGTVTITFDDGYASTYRDAYPILRESGMPATLFVTTDWLNRKKSYKGAEVMTVQQCRELSEAGWEIGSHTVTHPNLVHVSDSRLEAELGGSRQALESQGFIVQAIAYPGGSYDRRVHEAAGKYYPYHRLDVASIPFHTSSNPHGIIGNTLSDAVFDTESWLAFLDELRKNRQWGVFVVHDLLQERNPDPIALSRANFFRFVEVVRQLGIEVRTLMHAAETHATVPSFPDSRAVIPSGFQYNATRALYRLGLAPLAKRLSHETALGLRIELAIWHLVSRIKNRD